MGHGFQFAMSVYQRVSLIYLEVSKVLGTVPQFSSSHEWSWLKISGIFPAMVPTGDPPKNHSQCRLAKLLRGNGWWIRFEKWPLLCSSLGLKNSPNTLSCWWIPTKKIFALLQGSSEFPRAQTTIWPSEVTCDPTKTRKNSLKKILRLLMF